MTDDAELRARIEAQVAARRADAASSETDETPDGHAQESPENGTSARGGKALTPTRPWQRRGAAEEPESASDEPDAEPDSGATTVRRGGVGPARPWARRASQATGAHDELSGEPTDTTSTDEAAGGRLHPARPWRGRASTEPGRGESASNAPAPSHPHVVLHGISDEDSGGTPAPPARMRGLLQRGAGRRRVDDEQGIADGGSAASRDLAKRRAEAELRLAAEREQAQRALAEQRAATERELAEQRAATERELAERRAAAERELAEQRAEAQRLRAEREEAERELAERRAAVDELPEAVAVYASDNEAVDAFADPAGALSDQPVEDIDEQAQPGGRWPRRGRKPTDTAVAAEYADAPVAEPSGDLAAADEPAEEPYPWQQKEEVDLDLHGATAWDPGMYPPEEEPPQEHRGRRALRWLLARAPEPADEQAATQELEPTEPAAYEPAPRVDMPVAHLSIETADEAAADEPATTDEADAAGEPAAARGSLFARLRRRRADKAEEDEEEGFALPPVDEGWLEPPKPTRDWAKRTAPIELGATPDEIAAVMQQPEPDAEPGSADALEPVPEPEPVPVAAVEPEPEPVPEPTPTVRRRPSPGVAAGDGRPSPGVAAAAAASSAASVDSEPAAEPRRRPSPGAAPAAAAASTPAGRPMPSEASTATSTIGKPDTAPDISRFLEASEADEEEDEGDKDKTGRGGGDGRWRKTLTRSGVTLLIAALAAVLLRVFIVQPYYIPSASMEPTLHGCPGCNDDHVLVDKISYDVHGVRVGDIVVFHKPPNAQVPEDVLIKRVIALGGDRISMRHGRVYINGGLLDESYLNKDHSCYASDPAENFAPETVPDGEVFVMGDNRCNSEDSREFGPIKTSSIIGRAFMIVWPLDRVRFLGS